ncbi:MAG TPA: hypothetical protein VKX96_15330, partial [Chloroflexota bacterium]|nr:hypothetical protein [Chloroflexota bacterium]
MTRRLPLLYRFLIATFALNYALVACSPPNSRAEVLPAPINSAAPVSTTPTVPPTPTQPTVPVNPNAAAEYFKNFRSRHPEAAWPHWFADNQLAWSAIGLDGGGNEGLVATDGTFSPITNTLGVNVWLRDDSSGQLYVPRPADVTQSLDGGQRPLITSQWQASGIMITTTVFSASTGPSPIAPTEGAESVVVARVTLRGTGPARPLTLFLAVRPFGPAGGVSPLAQVATTATSIAANGKLVVVAQQPATMHGALNETEIDASVLAGQNKAPPNDQASSANGLAEGVLGYRLTLDNGQSITYSFVLPMAAQPPSSALVDQLSRLDVSRLQEQVSADWQQRLHQVELSVGDSDVTNAFYASLAYMLMARQGNQLYSGPLVEHAFWMRDAAYFTTALDQVGQHTLVDTVLRGILASQLPSGRFPPIIEPSGQPREPLKTEWDSQGEVIYALVEHARMTHDLGFLRDAYPSIIKAAQFQRDQLATTRTASRQGTPYYGIFPAGESAEDLLDPTWHHYWDDFWGMAGFQEAADAARQLGHTDDVAWLSQQENLLRQAVLNGVEQMPTSDGLPFIPNGPEDTHSTAMARSGTPALWPVDVLDPKSPLVQHTFEAYYQWTIKPYGGAYRHYGDNDWPYAGLSLAHAFYQLGMMDHVWTILQWTFAHQTAPHLYAWAEAVTPTSATFASGDMPHSWMAAELIMLVRDMLVREQDNAIAIGPFPDAWLSAGQHVDLKGMPTALGPVSYSMTRSADGRTIDLIL